ncbi:MAG: hypothetical protein M3Q39_12900, partial [Actinomycetota bacterium]|nr:hypothetical protein [Actinomycetota bacterium]
MDPDKAAFLAGVDELELDEYDAVVMARGALREMLVEQISDDEPPQVWQTARRLLDGGMERLDVLRQLVLALDSTMMTAMGRGVDLDRDGYVDVLDRLPVPAAERVEQVIVDIVCDRQPIDAEELDRLVCERLGMPLDDPLTETLFDRVQEHLLDDGPLAMLPPDVFVHVPSLTAGIVLTHRLTEAEREAGVLLVGDLPGFGRTELAWQGSAVWEYVGEDGRSRWLGQPGWLASLRPGLIAVRVDADGEVTITALDGEPACSAELVTSVRAAYDVEVAEPWLPVGAEDLLLGVLVRDRSAFTEPAPPLPELAAAAGLQEQDERYAHDESVWQEEERFRRHRRVLDRLGFGPQLVAALRVLAHVDEGVPDAATAHEVLRDLYDPDVLEVVPDELLGAADDPELVDELVALAGRLLAVASKPGERAVAHWLAALADERRGAVLDAESHLREAVRVDPD